MKLLQKWTCITIPLTINLPISTKKKKKKKKLRSHKTQISCTHKRAQQSIWRWGDYLFWKGKYKRMKKKKEKNLEEPKSEIYGPMFIAKGDIRLSMNFILIILTVFVDGNARYHAVSTFIFFFFSFFSFYNWIFSFSSSSVFFAVQFFDKQEEFTKTQWSSAYLFSFGGFIVFILFYIYLFPFPCVFLQK